MRKISLLDNDFEFFDIEMTPLEFQFFQRHRDAFVCMWKEQGKPFWTKFTITFRSFTVKHGVIKQMACTTPKFEHLLDQAFIYIHENFVDGRESNARHFIEDIAKLAQNHNRLQSLDSKSLSKDPFYIRETRELFRRLFGQPDDKASYMKVYILSPIYLRFGGSLCRCIKKWMEAPEIDCNDDSYWTPPSGPTQSEAKAKESKVIMCQDCLDECGTLFMKEKRSGDKSGPKFISFWTYGNPRFNDCNNPLYCPNSDTNKDWRDTLTVEDFRDFLNYAKFNYGTESEKCQECQSLMLDKTSHGNSGKPKKKKKKSKKKIEITMTNLVDEVLGSAKARKKEENSADKPTADAASNFPGLVYKDQYSNTIIDMNSFTNALFTGRNNIPEVKLLSGRKRKTVFTARASVTVDHKYGFMSLNQVGVPKTPVDGITVGFKITHLEERGKWELKLTVVSRKDRDKEIIFQPKEKPPTKMLRTPYAEMLYSRVENMPENLEWWDGDTFCVCSLDFEKEEREFCNKKNKKQPSKFAIKVSNEDDEVINGTLFKLLTYVGKRKKRESVGWCLTDEDLMNCILPHNMEAHEGLTITVMRGFNFRDRLTIEEENALKQRRTARKTLMAVDTSTVFTLLLMPNGKEILKDIVEEAGKSINDVIAKRRTYKEELDTMTKNLDDFEILTAIENDQVPYMQSLGLHIVDDDHPDKVILDHSPDATKQQEMNPELQVKIKEFLAEYNEKSNVKERKNKVEEIQKNDLTSSPTIQSKEMIIHSDKKEHEIESLKISQKVVSEEKTTSASSTERDKNDSLNKSTHVEQSSTVPIKNDPQPIKVDDINDKVNKEDQNDLSKTQQSYPAEVDSEETKEVEHGTLSEPQQCDPAEKNKEEIKEEDQNNLSESQQSDPAEVDNGKIIEVATISKDIPKKVAISQNIDGGQ